MLDAPTLPLTMVAPGRRVRLVQVNGGEPGCRRLAELGLTPGVEMSVLQDEGGPLMVCVRGSRIALGRGLAHKLQVTDCEQCPQAQWAEQRKAKSVWLRGRGSCCDPEPGEAR